MAKRLLNGRVAFFCCDIQDRFRPLIFQFPAVLHTAKKLISAAKVLQLPLVVTEQYPKALGKTASELDISHAVLVEAKTRFSMFTPTIRSFLKTSKIDSVVLFGIESHVCVLQTTLDLLDVDMNVFVVSDGTSSSNRHEIPIALQRMRDSGAVVTTSDSLLFELCGDATHPNFKDISALVKIHDSAQHRERRQNLPGKMTVDESTLSSPTQTSQTAPTPSVYKLTDIEAIKKELAALESQELELERELGKYLTTVPKPPVQLLHKLRELVQAHLGEAETLAETVGKTATLAESISGKVRQLDQEQGRVKQALAQVQNAQELKSCVEGVQRVIKDRQYEMAAHFISTFLSFDARVIQELASQSILSFDDGDQITIDEAMNIMRKARADVREIALVEFDNAARSGREELLLIYWKIFALIGEHEIGLEKFTHFLTSAIRKANDIPLSIGEKGGVSFVDSVTSLFESVAAVIDAHEPRIRDVYGPGRMLHVVRGFENYANLQFVKVMDLFAEKRALQRKIRDIQTSGDKTKPADEKVDLRELALVLDEIALISQKVSIFQRFMIVRAEGEMATLRGIEKPDAFVTTLLNASFNYSSTTGLLKLSEMTTRLRDCMSSYYIPFESYFLTQSIRKALRMDTFRLDSEELISSCVEDCFFIMKKVVLRAVLSHDVDTICVILNLLSRSLEVEYLRNGIQKRILSSYGGDKAALLSEQPDAKIGYMILLNNLECSCKYVEKLCQEVEYEVGLMLKDLSGSAPESNHEKIKSCLAPVQESVQVFQQILRQGLENLFAQTFKVKLKPILHDAFGSIRFNLTEAEFDESDFNGDVATLASSIADSTLSSLGYATTSKDGLIKKFVGPFDKLIKDGYDRYLTDNNFLSMIQHCVDYIVREWERVIFTSNSRINSYGALRMDKDVRTLQTFLTSLLSIGSVKDRFLRLASIATLLNMESVQEINDYGPIDTAEWRLSSQEIRKVLSLRFGHDEVARLKI